MAWCISNSPYLRDAVQQADLHEDRLPSPAECEVVRGSGKAALPNIRF